MSVYYLFARSLDSIHFIIDLVALMIFNEGYVDESRLCESVTVYLRYWQ